VQSVYPAGQVKVQVPDKQTSPAAQAAWHAPQCEGSFEVFLQMPEQSVYPSGQSGVQAPPTHRWPAAQVIPHEPQL